MKTICVYLGASSGNNLAFKEAVIKLAHEIVAYGLTLVYGGSRLGMALFLSSIIDHYKLDFRN